MASPGVHTPFSVIHTSGCPYLLAIQAAGRGLPLISVCNGTEQMCRPHRVDVQTPTQQQDPMRTRHRQHQQQRSVRSACLWSTQPSILRRASGVLNSQNTSDGSPGGLPALSDSTSTNTCHASTTTYVRAAGVGRLHAVPPSSHHGTSQSIVAAALLVPDASSPRPGSASHWPW